MSLSVVGPAPAKHMERGTENKKVKTVNVQENSRSSKSLKNAKPRQALRNLSNTAHLKGNTVSKVQSKLASTEKFTVTQSEAESEDIEYMPPPPLSNQDDDYFQPPPYINEFVGVVSKPSPLFRVRQSFSYETFDANAKFDIFQRSNNHFDDLSVQNDLENLTISLPFDLSDL